MKNEYAITTARDLGTIRKDAGLSQTQLGQRLDMPQSHVSRTERSDLGRMHVDSLERFAKALGYDLDIRFVPREDDDARRNA